MCSTNRPVWSHQVLCLLATIVFGAAAEDGRCGGGGGGGPRRLRSAPKNASASCMRRRRDCCRDVAATRRAASASVWPGRESPRTRDDAARARAGGRPPPRSTPTPRPRAPATRSRQVGVESSSDRSIDAARCRAAYIDRSAACRCCRVYRATGRHADGQSDKQTDTVPLHRRSPLEAGSVKWVSSRLWENNALSVLSRPPIVEYL